MRRREAACQPVAKLTETKSGSATESRRESGKETGKETETGKGKWIETENATENESGTRKEKERETEAETRIESTTGNRKEKEKETLPSDVRSDSYPERRGVRKGNTVYVYGSGLGEDNLRSSFSQHGTIIDLSMDNPRNCAFITFEKMESADQAVAELNGAMVGDVHIKVSIARKQPMLDAATGKSVWASLDPRTDLPTGCGALQSEELKTSRRRGYDSCSVTRHSCSSSRTLLLASSLSRSSCSCSEFCPVVFPCCSFRWRRKAGLWAKRAWQYAQRCGRSPLWRFMWSIRVDFWVNVL
ncbi:Negative elongation factor E [Liparis tanakae]|uniref:Negative elongation factor E n=1 Tax=Liparis tanakae TaxID=230148 RepID=A0A4Z2H4I8_9TELE|nr:Negative elongation factor E [Liparis tanakae]